MAKEARIHLFSGFKGILVRSARLAWNSEVSWSARVFVEVYLERSALVDGNGRERGRWLHRTALCEMSSNG